MRHSQLLVGVCALGMFAVGNPVQGGWNNVFEVACWRNNSTSAYGNVAYSYPGVAAESYYAPQFDWSSSYYQPVTPYWSSYYYQPVSPCCSSYYYQPVSPYWASYYYQPAMSYQAGYYYLPVARSRSARTNLSGVSEFTPVVNRQGTGLKSEDVRSQKQPTPTTQPRDQEPVSPTAATNSAPSLTPPPVSQERSRPTYQTLIPTTWKK